MRTILNNWIAGAALSTLGLLSACDRAPHSAANPHLTADAPARAAPVDEFQTMAIAAGKDLIGKPAKALDFKTLDGHTITLGPPLARPIYLKFWATWCTICRAQMPALKADFERYGKDIDVVAVNTGVNDDRAAVEAYRRQVPMPMPIAIDDGRLGEAFHLKVTPQHVIIGRDGLIRYVGHLEDDQLHNALQAAIANKPLSVAGSTSSEAVAEQPDRRGGALATVQGGTIRIDDPSDASPRLLYFFSPWCESYLKRSRPGMAMECKATREALTRASGSGRATVVGIASGLSAGPDDVQRYVRRTGFNVPIVMDGAGALFRRYGVKSFPAVIRLDTAGHPAGRLTANGIDALPTKSAK